MIKLTSSEIVTQAMGIEPDGIPSDHDGECAFCGSHIETGGLYVPFQVSRYSGFMDDLSLASRGSDMVCVHCAPLMTADALRKTGHGVFSKEGVRPFHKWIDVAQSLLNPPKSPFVMLFATAKNQHMAWRAPVNYSSDMFYVRLGLRDVKIRLKYLIGSIKYCEHVAESMGRKKNADQKTLLHPFMGLSSDLKDITHADLSITLRSLHSKEEFKHLLEDKKFLAGMNHLMGLTLGESWALRFVLTPGAGTSK